MEAVLSADDFADLSGKFKERANDLIPGIAKITGVELGYVKRMSMGRADMTLWGPSPGGESITTREISCSVETAQRFGPVESQLPVALVEYRDAAGACKKALVPWDKDTFQ